MKQGVVDIQARLDIGALVIGMFEDEKLDQTARSVEDMYAEPRGMPTSRIIACDLSHERGRVFVAVKEDDN